MVLKLDDFDKYLDEVRDRIFDLLKSAPMSQKDFAKEIGVSPQTITDWKKGKSRSYLQKLPRIAYVLYSTMHWVSDGIGHKSYADDKEEQAFDSLLRIAYMSRFFATDEEVLDKIVDEGPPQPYLVMRYNSLPPKVQEEVMAFIEFKVAQQSEKK